MRTLMKRRVWLPTALLLIGTATATASAEAECKVVPHTFTEIQNAVYAGSELRRTLDQSGAQLAIVGRIGSDQSKRGIRFTHAGIAWRDHAAGPWHFTHLLNHCGSDRSQLFDDGPVDFFLERPFSYTAQIIVPVEALQEALAKRLANHEGGALHEPRYSAIAHPFRTRYQNSNQWILELIAIALDPEAPPSRERAQLVLRGMSYQPERVRLGFFERVGTHRMGNVTLKDHSRRELRQGGFAYVSVKSVARFLEEHDLAKGIFEVRCEPCRDERASSAAR